jgi:uncharacterized glyoxalase superfamily protein PhnB
MAAPKAKKKAAKAAKKTVARHALKKSVRKPVKKSKRTAKTAPAKAAKKAPASRGFALQSVAPGFTANDAAATIAWYCDVLGFTRGQQWDFEGKFMGGEVKSGDVTINIGQDDWKLGRDRVKGQGTRMYIMTGPDIDAYADGIKARGGTLASEPKDEWGMRAFAINDPDGFKLTFMTPSKK